MEEVKIRPIPELLKVLRDNSDKIIHWQLPLDGIGELVAFHNLFSIEEMYLLVGLLVEWGVKPDEYLTESMWNILDNIINFYTEE